MTREYKWCPHCQSDTLHTVSGCSGCEATVGAEDEDNIGDTVLKKMLPWALGGLVIGFYIKSKSKRK